MFKKIRHIVYKVLFSIDRLFGQETNILVLTYHSISNDGWRFSTPLAEFKKQLEYLSNFFNFVTISEFKDALQLNEPPKEPSVLITFDDGYKDILTAREVIKKYGAKPVVFALDSPEEANRRELQNDKELLGKNDLVRLVKDGWTLGSHSSTHANLFKLSNQELKDEIRDTGKKYFAYPKGRYNSKIVGQVKKVGYLLAFSMDDGFINNTVNKYTIPRVGIEGTYDFDDFKASFSPSVIMFRKLIKGLMRQ